MEIEAALHALSMRYARGVDRRDAEMFVSAFHPDARVRVYSPSESSEPRSELTGHSELAKIPELIRVYAKTFHFVGNSAYDIADGRATGEVYCLAHHLTPDRHGGTNYVMYIRYQDRYHPGPDGVWKIADRRVLIDWTEVRPANTAGR